MSARPCTVGLTGGLASGKSSVASLLVERGAAVLDADAVVHHLYRPGAEGARVVVDLFGPSVLNEDGSVDRSRLGEQVLSERGAVSRLNAAIHPLVRQHVDHWLEGLESLPDAPAVAVVEAALLVETGGWRRYDLLMVVWCRPEQQLERAVTRGVPPDRARALLAHQRPLTEKRSLADLWVDNSGDPPDLVPEVDRAWEALQRMCAERPGE